MYGCVALYIYIMKRNQFYKFTLTKTTPKNTSTAESIRNFVKDSFKKSHDNKIIKITAD